MGIIYGIRYLWIPDKVGGEMVVSVAESCLYRMLTVGRQQASSESWQSQERCCGLAVWRFPSHSECDNRCVCGIEPL